MAATGVLIVGPSGSGKSASMRNFKGNQVGVISVASKPLPFRANGIKMAKTSDYGEITKILKNCNAKSIVIDDSQYLMVFQNFKKANSVGYQKYTQMAVHFGNLVMLLNDLPDDKIVYFLHHEELDSNTGTRKAKTLGKMLDSQLTLEGMFSICLWAQTDGKKHTFVTQSDGTTTAKSPIGMFSNLEIDNDLAAVDKTIREYYGLEVNE